MTIFLVLLGNSIWRAGSFSIDRGQIFSFFKDLFFCFLATLSIIVPALLYYVSQSSLVKLFYSIKEGYAPTNIQWVSDFFGAPDPIKALTTFHIGSLNDLFFFLFILLYLYIGGKVIIHFYQKRKDFPLLFPIVIMGILSLTYASIPFSKAHLLQVAAMAYLLFGFVVYSFLERKGILSRVILVALILFLGLYILDSFRWRGYFASGSISRLYVEKENRWLIPSKKAKIYVGKIQFDMVHGLIEFFEKREGYLMSLFFDPMINFLTGLDNPTRFNMLLPPFLEDRSNQKQVMEEVERYKIQYLLIPRSIWTSQDNLGFSRYAPILYDYVTERYELEKEIGGYLIFSRRSL